MKRSVLFRHTLVAALLIFGAVGNITSVYSVWNLYNHLTAEYTKRASAIARAIASSSAEIFLNRDAATIQSIIDPFVESQGVHYVAVTDGDSRIVAHTLVPRVPDNVRALITEVDRSRGEDPADRYEVTVRKTGTILDVSAPIMAGVAGRVHVGMDIRSVRRLVRPAVIRMQLILLGVFCAAAVLIYLGVRSITRPVAELTDYARKVAAHDFSGTLHIRRKDEIGELAAAMESMSEELSAKFEGLQTSVKTTSQELEEALLHLSTLMGSLADGLVVVDDRGRITRTNPAFAEQFEAGDADPTGQPCRDWVGPEIASLLTEVLDPDKGASNRLEPRECIARARTGRKFPAEISVARVHSRGRTGAVAIVRDITDRKRTREALREARDDLEIRVEARTAELAAANVRLEHEVEDRRQAQVALARETELLTVTLRSIADGVVTADTEGRVVLVNPVAEALLGWQAEDARGRPFRSVFHPTSTHTGEPVPDPVERVIRTARRVEDTEDALLAGHDGVERFVSAGAAPIFDDPGRMVGVVVVLRDVTGRRRMEQEIQRADKLESLGVLAGGIAHDFNNVLGAIVANLSLARHQLTHDPEPAELVTEAENAAVRARALTQQLLTFARGGTPQPRPTDTEQLLEDATRFALRGSRVACRFLLPDGLWPVFADEGQIAQVVHNLALNALQAMPDGGILDVSAENRRVAAEDPLPLPQGEYVRICLRDHGSGMAPEVRKQAFDPYFTTKNSGTGLGLAVVYSVIRKHGGLVSLTSEPGLGTHATFYLPAADEVPSPTATEPDDLVRGTGRILVMDDEEGLRRVCAKILRYLGYEVELAKNGHEAVELCGAALRDGHPFGVAILDLTVPGSMGGEEALVTLREIDPDLRVIAASGYVNDTVLARYRERGFDGAVPKPFRASALSRAVAQVIAVRRREES